MADLLNTPKKQKQPEFPTISYNDFQEAVVLLPLQRTKAVHDAMVIGTIRTCGQLCTTIAAAWMMLPFEMDSFFNNAFEAAVYVAGLATCYGVKMQDLVIDPADASELSNELAAAVLGRNPPAISLIWGTIAARFADEYFSISEEPKRTLLTLGLYLTTMDILCNVHGAEMPVLLYAGLHDPKKNLLPPVHDKLIKHLRTIH